jgi:hypothetical protein
LTDRECTLLEERIAVVYADVPLIVGRVKDILNGREISLPEDASDEADDEVVAKNLDLSNAAPKDPSKPAVSVNKPKVKSDGGE